MRETGQCKFQQKPIISDSYEFFMIKHKLDPVRIDRLYYLRFIKDRHHYWARRDETTQRAIEVTVTGGYLINSALI